MKNSIAKLVLLATLFVAFCPIRVLAQGDAIRTISPTVATSSVVVIGYNRWRTGFTIYNNSSNTVYITYGPVASGATPTRVIGSFTQFDMFGPAVYRGEMSAIRNAGTGTLIITEYIYSN